MSVIVLLRHGESLWNKENVFTGWVDVPLSQKGVEEALRAGEEISEIEFDLIYVSTLVRSLETAMLCMTKNKSDKTPVVIHREGDQQDAWSKIYDEAMMKKTIPVYRDWHLNERYYGELQGKNKKETAEIYGEEKVHMWRRSYDIPPPHGECLKDTAERTIPFFEKHIVPFLKEGKNMLVAAHGNSLRSIVMYLDHLTSDEVLKLEIATGVPIIYQFENECFSKLMSS